MTDRRRRALALSLAAAMLAGLLAGCEKREEVPGQLSDDTTESAAASVYPGVDRVFTLNYHSQQSLNPFQTTDETNILVTQLLYSQLYSVDDRFTAAPLLVKSAKTEDGVNWTFTVDTSVQFWDGSTLTAKDAAYSLQLARASKQFSERLKVIAGVSALSETDFSVTLNYTDRQLPALLAVPVIKYGTGNNAVPTGCGPYAPDDAHTKLTAFSGYKNASKLPLDTIYLKEYTDAEQGISAFEDGTLDLVTNDPTSIYSYGYGSANDERYYPTANLNYLGFNCRSGLFSKAECRKAMNYVVDRDTIATDYMDGAGTPAVLPLSPASPLYSDAYTELLSYSVKKAEQAFDDAQVQDYDNDGKREMKVTDIPTEINLVFLVCSDSPIKVRAARAIADTLTQIGFTVELKELAFNEYQSALKNGNFDLYYAETRMTPDFSLRNLLFYGGSLNYGGYSDSQFEEDAQNFLGAADDARTEAANTFFTYFTDSTPILPICFDRHAAITHRAVVSGMEPSDYNIFNNIDNWKVSFG